MEAERLLSSRMISGIYFCNFALKSNAARNVVLALRGKYRTAAISELLSTFQAAVFLDINERSLLTEKSKIRSIPLLSESRCDSDIHHDGGIRSTTVAQQDHQLSHWIAEGCIGQQYPISMRHQASRKIDFIFQLRSLGINLIED